MEFTGYFAGVLAAVAVGLLAYLSYPLVETATDRGLKRYIDWVVDLQERMFHPVSRRGVLLFILISPLAFGLVGFVLSYGQGWATAIFSGVFAFFGWLLPRLVVSFQWQRRLARFDVQLVDGLNLMANSLKSGLNLNQVIQVLVKEMPNPISQEFGLVLSQEKLGLTVDEALAKMTERIPSEDLSLAVHSVLILRETGGDLSETFDVIAATIRERRKVDGKIKAMTQQGKMQGLLLILMPFGLGGMIYIMNPGFLEPLFTTRLGWMMIAVMLLFQLVGALWVKKVVTIHV